MQAEVSGKSAMDMVEGLGVDKSQVYRWFKGQTPHATMQKQIADLFGIDAADLLREPRPDDYRKEAGELLSRLPPQVRESQLQSLRDLVAVLNGEGKNARTNPASSEEAE